MRDDRDMYCTKRLFSLALGVMFAFFLCGCVYDVKKNDEKMGIESERMAEKNSVQVRNVFNSAETEKVWTELDANDYYEDLVEKTKKIDHQSWRDLTPGFGIAYPELKALCRALSIEHPKGFDGELPEISDDAAEEFIKQLIACGDIRRLEDGTLELLGRMRRVMLPVIEPYVYIKCTSEDGVSTLYYFNDTSLTIAEYDIYVLPDRDYDESGYGEDISFADINPIAYPEERYRPTGFGHKNYKYKVVNCKTGMEKEYKLDANMDQELLLKEEEAIMEAAWEQSISFDREKHLKMIYECIQDIIDMVGIDVNRAKLLYEDCCWGTGTDVESIESYDADKRTLLVKGMDRMEYECRLDEDGDVYEVYEKGGERVFHDDSKTEQPGKRKKSLVDLSILKN